MNRWASGQLLLLIAACSVQGACGSNVPPEAGQQAAAPEQPASEPGTAEPAEKPAVRRIAVIPKGTTHEFWKSVHAGANKAGKELGIKII